MSDIQDYDYIDYTDSVKMAEDYALARSPLILPRSPAPSAIDPSITLTPLTPTPITSTPITLARSPPIGGRSVDDLVALSRAAHESDAGLRNVTLDAELMSASPPHLPDSRRHCRHLAVSNGRARRMSEGNIVSPVGPGSSLQVPAQNNLSRRKLSFPASFHSNLLGLNSLGEQNGAASKRRFSNVSDVVSRKFSNTIGWRQQIPIQDIVTQGKTLVGQYMRCRLKRAGLFSRKCGLQRLRSVSSLPGGFVIREVFPRLLTIGQELERLHPKLYSGVTRQASSHNGVVFITEKTVNAVLIQVARELSRQDLSWAKVVSLYCVAGGLAVDCVRQGHPEYLPSLIETMGEILEEEIAIWIADMGGWTSLCNYCRPPNNELSLTTCVAMFSAAVTSIVIVVLSLRWFGKVAFF